MSRKQTLIIKGRTNNPVAVAKAAQKRRERSDRLKSKFGYDPKANATKISRIKRVAK